MAKKGLFPWILAIVALAVAGYSYNRIQSAKLKALEERVKTRDHEISELKTERAEIRKRLDELAVAIAETDEKAAAREAWLRKQIEKTNAATPQQLVDEGSRILEAKDITTDGKAVTMGIETWRRAVKIFQSEEGYRLTKEPDWRERLRLRDETITTFKIDALAAAKQIANLEANLKDYKDFVGKQKAASLGEKLLYVGLGFALGTAAEKIF